MAEATTEQRQEAQQVAEQTAQATAQAQAAEGATPAEARQEATHQATQAAQAAAPRLSDEDVDRIARRQADIQIEELEKRGAFDEPHRAEPAAQQGQQTATASGGPPEPAPIPPEQHEVDAQRQEPPRKRTFAERFVGRK